MVKKNIYASYLFIVINILCNVLVVSLTVKHYGSNLFAFIVLAYSFIVYFETFNLGVFISNRTILAMKGDYSSVYTLTSFRFLTLIALSLLIIIVPIYITFGPTFVSMISSEADPVVVETGVRLILISIIYGIVKIPLSLVLSAFSGNDFVHIEKKYNTFQQIFKLVSLLFAIGFNFSAIQYFLGFCISSSFLLVLANIHFYIKFIKHRFDKFKKYSKKISTKYVLNNSLKFFIFTFASVIVWSTDNLIVSIFFNPKMVSDYHINFSLFNAGFLFVTAISGALVANYGFTVRKREFEKLTNKLNLSIYVGVCLSLLIGLGAVLFSKEILNLWVGPGHFISYPLIMNFSFFGVFLAITSVTNGYLSLFLSAKKMILISVSEAVMNLCCSVVFLKIWGVLGVAFGTCVAIFICVVLPGVYFSKKSFNQQVQIYVKDIVLLLIISVPFFILSLKQELFSKTLLFQILYFLSFVLVLLIFTYKYKRQYVELILKIKND